MANQWLRLWHDMPTDPKWRTISRVSGQRIGDVIAVFTHLLVCASNATERGRTQSFNCEDVASALDLETEQVSAIVDAMQSRVLDGDRLKGWEVRQVAREDGSAERAKAWREAKKAQKQDSPNAPERSRTPDKDTDTDKEDEEAKASLSTSKLPDCPHLEIIESFAQHLPNLPQPKPELWTGARAKALHARWVWVLTAKKRTGERYATDRASALAFFSRFFAYVANSCPHLNGDNDRTWTADLAWLCKADNFAKVMQGNYEQKRMEAA